MATFQEPTGEAIRAIRKRYGLTQRDLAALAGLHPNSVKALERWPVVSRESWHSLGKVARALQVKGAAIPFPWFEWHRRGFPRAPVMPMDARLRLTNANPPKRAQGLERLGFARAAEVCIVARKLRCEAMTRKKMPCQCKALANGRCKFHGGLSTGPKTAAGRARIAEAQRARWDRWRQSRELSLKANSVPASM